MPLEFVLGNLLADNDHAVCALLLDESGETVDFASSGLAPYDARVMGAYLGIYLRQLGTLAERTALGEPRRLHIEKGEIHIYVDLLPEGYYLVLVQERPGLVARARASLSEAAEQLRREVF